jgi:Domain of unknown function (DUF4845)
MNTPSKQSGISFLGLLFVGIVVACVGVVAAQVAPTVLEYSTIRKAAQKAADTGGTVAEIRDSFEKSSQIDDFKSISSKDLEITKVGEKVVVSFAYEREIPLVGPAYLLLKYEGRSK